MKRHIGLYEKRVKAGDWMLCQARDVVDYVE